MGFFEQIFGTELSGVGRYVTAFILVMALIALTAWLMRRFGDTRTAKAGGGRGRQQRLAVLDSAVVDARRRLVLIRRDNVEHLILIGGPTDVVVEPNIVRASALAAPAPAPRPARTSVFEPIETIDYEASLIPYPETAYEEPRPAPPPQPQLARPATPEPRPGARPAAQRLDPQYADMAHRLEAALRKPASEGDGAARPRTPTPPMPRATERPVAAPPIRAPEPRQPAPTHAPVPAPKTAADVFGNLEDEMASLLRPGNKTTQ